jgi:hypothetical protein
MLRLPLAVSFGSLLVSSAIRSQAVAAELPGADRGQLTVEASMSTTSGHVDPSGPDQISPPPFAMDANLRVRLLGPIGIGLLVGANLAIGWELSPSARFALRASPIFSFSAGAGPLFTWGGEFGLATFVRGDVTFDAQVSKHCVLSFGPAVAVAVTHAGVPGCGTDTCNAWVVPGDSLVTLRLGVGLSF